MSEKLTPTKNQFVDKTEALKIAAAISSTGDRTLLIENLNDKITEQDLRVYFGSFGAISDVDMKCNSAFIAFETELAFERALAQGKYVLQGQVLKVERAKLRNNRIFVSGLPPGTKKVHVLRYFEYFGPVLKIETPKNPHAQTIRDFCFVALYSERLAFDVLMVKKHIFKGKEIDVKRALPKNTAKKFQENEVQEYEHDYEQEFYDDIEDTDSELELELLNTSRSSTDSCSSTDSFASLPIELKAE